MDRLVFRRFIDDSRPSARELAKIVLAFIIFKVTNHRSEMTPRKIKQFKSHNICIPLFLAQPKWKWISRRYANHNTFNHLIDRRGVRVEIIQLLKGLRNDLNKKTRDYISAIILKSRIKMKVERKSKVDNILLHGKDRSDVSSELSASLDNQVDVADVSSNGHPTAGVDDVIVRIDDSLPATVTEHHSVNSASLIGHCTLLDDATGLVIMNCSKETARNLPVEHQRVLCIDVTKLTRKNIGLGIVKGMRWDELPWSTHSVREFASVFIHFATAIAIVASMEGFSHLIMDKRVILYCKNGRSRSPSIIAAFFILFRGFTFEEVEDWFLEAYPAQRPETQAISVQGGFPNLKRFEQVLQLIVYLKRSFEPGFYDTQVCYGYSEEFRAQIKQQIEDQVELVCRDSRDALPLLDSEENLLPALMNMLAMPSTSTRIINLIYTNHKVLDMMHPSSFCLPRASYLIAEAEASEAKLRVTRANTKLRRASVPARKRNSLTSTIKIEKQG